MAAVALKSGQQSVHVEYRDQKDSVVVLGSPVELRAGEDHPLSPRNRSASVEGQYDHAHDREVQARKLSATKAVLDIARRALTIKNTSRYDTVPPEKMCDYKMRVATRALTGAAAGFTVGVGLTIGSAGFGVGTIPVTTTVGFVGGGLYGIYEVHQEISKGYEAWQKEQTTENLQRFNRFLSGEEFNHFREGNSLNGKLMLRPIVSPSGRVIDFSTWEEESERGLIRHPNQWKIDYKRMGITRATIKRIIEVNSQTKEGERLDPIAEEGLRVLAVDLGITIDNLVQREELRVRKAFEREQISKKEMYRTLANIAEDVDPELPSV